MAAELLNKNDIFRSEKMIQRAYNSSPHSALENETPIFVMFGKIDDTLRNKFGIPLQEVMRAEELENKLHEFRERISKILEENFKKYANYYNRNRKEWYLTEGTRVMLKTPFPLKMDRKNTGPYKVLKVLGPSSIVIKTNEDGDLKFGTILGRG